MIHSVTTVICDLINETQVSCPESTPKETMSALAAVGIGAITLVVSVIASIVFPLFFRRGDHKTRQQDRDDAKSLLAIELSHVSKQRKRDRKEVARNRAQDRATVEAIEVRERSRGVLKTVVSYEIDCNSSGAALNRLAAVLSEIDSENDLDDSTRSGLRIRAVRAFCSRSESSFAAIAEATGMTRDEFEHEAVLRQVLSDVTSRTSTDPLSGRPAPACDAESLPDGGHPMAVMVLLLENPTFELSTSAIRSLVEWYVWTRGKSLHVEEIVHLSKHGAMATALMDVVLGGGTVADGQSIEDGTRATVLSGMLSAERRLTGGKHVLSWGHEVNGPDLELVFEGSELPMLIGDRVNAEFLILRLLEAMGKLLGPERPANHAYERHTLKALRWFEKWLKTINWMVDATSTPIFDTMNLFRAVSWFTQDEADCLARILREVLPDNIDNARSRLRTSDDALGWDGSDFFGDLNPVLRRQIQDHLVSSDDQGGSNTEAEQVLAVGIHP